MFRSLIVPLAIIFKGQKAWIFGQNFSNLIWDNVSKILISFLLDDNEKKEQEEVESLSELAQESIKHAITNNGTTVKGESECFNWNPVKVRDSVICKHGSILLEVFIFDDYLNLQLTFLNGSFSYVKS